MEEKLKQETNKKFLYSFYLGKLIEIIWKKLKIISKIIS